MLPVDLKYLVIYFIRLPFGPTLEVFRSAESILPLMAFVSHVTKKWSLTTQRSLDPTFVIFVLRPRGREIRFSLTWN